MSTAVVLQTCLEAIEHRVMDVILLAIVFGSIGIYIFVGYKEWKKGR